MRYVLFSILLILGSTMNSQAQYKFSSEKIVNCTEVKNQQKTGTCWSFATTSFLESEAIRMGNKNVDLSEMHVVQNIYKDKALNYILRQGKANFSQGALAHDLINSVTKYGIVPESEYSGRKNSDAVYNHAEMEKGLKGFLNGVISAKKINSHNWQLAVDAILNIYMGEAPNTFEVDGVSMTPGSYAKSLQLDTRNYINLTSFSHHSFYNNFILEVPDNYSNGSFFNVPLDDLQSTVDHALSKGYTIAWDGDVSEKGFSAKDGLAILPIEKSDDMFKTPGEEIKVNQANRQEGFMNFSTSDDHLMHLVGTAKDQNGNRYYIIKNSWGTISDYKGYLYMSEAYFRMKTIGILLNKEALPSKVSKHWVAN